MRIDHYAFGTITVDGRTYTSDIIILPGRIIPSWWRKEGHKLQPEDLDEVVAAGIGTLIVGTGAYGVMKVPDETREYLKSKGITTFSFKSAKAVEEYNRTAGKDDSLAAAFHLTC